MAATVEKPDIAFNKEILIVVPILGSALAMIYDVGFFNGIGMSLFTLFSLSEHILFAVEVLPMGLLMAASLGITMSYEAERPVGRVIREKWPSGERFVLPILVLLSITMLSVMSFYFGLYYSTIGGAMGCAFFVVALYSSGITRRLLYAAFGITILTFSIGHDDAKQYLQPTVPYRLSRSFATTTIQTRSEPTIQARIIRSGDRGLLFYNLAERHITILRWDEITKINASP